MGEKFTFLLGIRRCGKRDNNNNRRIFFKLLDTVKMLDFAIISRSFQIILTVLRYMENHLAFCLHLNVVIGPISSHTVTGLIILSLQFAHQKTPPL